MHFLVAGASGFLGRHLVEGLRANGDEVRTLVRSAPERPDDVAWDPAAGRLDPSALDGVDVVVNVAGSPTIGNPHSKTWARNLLESRLSTTRTLAEAIAAASRTGRRSWPRTAWAGTATTARRSSPRRPTAGATPS